MSGTYVTAVLVDDETGEIIKPARKKSHITVLKTRYNSDGKYEIGVDEVGRGPLLGRVYCAAVVLPSSEDDFEHAMMKDSKRFHSIKKINAAAEYIKEFATAWAVAYEDEKTIDRINILNATQSAMHAAITSVKDQLVHSGRVSKWEDMRLLIDGSYFKQFKCDISGTGRDKPIDHETVVGGDNTYTSIAAASILAKVARDEYIARLCDEHPELDDNYSIRSNKGYGAAVHMAGIKTHGVTPWHRMSFGPCKPKAAIRCLI